MTMLSTIMIYAAYFTLAAVEWAMVLICACWLLDLYFAWLAQGEYDAEHDGGQSSILARGNGSGSFLQRRSSSATSLANPAKPASDFIHGKETGASSRPPTCRNFPTQPEGAALLTPPISVNDFPQTKTPTAAILAAQQRRKAKAV